jgi:DNA-binding transcriptional LysR family regulator
MIKFDIDDLYLVRAIDEGLSMSALAVKLSVDASTVSRRIAKIETIVGTSIVSRSGKFRLTEAGSRFLQMAIAVLREHDEFQNDLLTIKTGKKILRIFGNSSIMISDTPQVLEVLKERNSDANISIRSGSMSEIIKKIQNGECDVGIVPDKSRVQGVQFQRYRSERLCVLVPISHHLASVERVSLADIAAYELIGTDETRQISALISSMAKKNFLKLTYGITVSNFDLQASLIAQTACGIGVVFESVARRFEKIHPVKVLTLAEEWAERDLYVCTPKPEVTSQLAKDFAELLKARHRKVPRQ